MPNVVLFEDWRFRDFLPLAYWRCLAALRAGRKSLMDNAAYWLRRPVTGVWVRDWIAERSTLCCQIPANRPADGETILVNSRWLLDKPVEFQAPPFVGRSGDQIAYIACDGPLAGRLTPDVLLDEARCLEAIQEVPSGDVDAQLVAYPWDLIERNGDVMRAQWAGDDRGVDGHVSSSAHLVNLDYIHIGERSDIKPTAVIDADNGPVYISNDVTIGAHTCIEGPCFIGAGTEVRPHAHIRSGTSIGAMARVGGEIVASIILSHTNKQHAGFLGHSYVGSWVNLGAGTTNSNLKNTYGSVNIQMGDRVIPTGQRFVGGVIGDFTRLGIGTLIPTGAVIGFAATCATGGLLPKHVPSFAWLTPDGLEKGDPVRLLEVARTMMSRRNVDMHTTDVAVFNAIAKLAEQYRI